MKQEQADATVQQLGKLIGHMLGADVQVEAIVVPPGSSITEELAKRGIDKDEIKGQPCDLCGEVHEESTTEDRQAKAILALDRRIAHLERIAAHMRKLQQSIATPVAERKPGQVIQELMMAMEMNQMFEEGL